MSAKDNVTMRDIARAAGVSVAAVSKALRNEPDIGPETTARVQKIALEHGYNPNKIAKSLRTGRTNVVGVIIPDNSNPYNAMVLRGVDESLRASGYVAIIGNSDNRPDVERELLSSMIALKVDGVLAIPVDLESFSTISLPLVFMSRSPTLAEGPADLIGHGWSYVVNDDYHGEYLATSHLIKRGYEVIFLLAGHNNDGAVEKGMTEARVRGYRQALLDHGREFREGNVTYGAVSAERAFAACKQILTGKLGRVGICAYNDYSAMGVLAAVHELGLRIPDDVGVVGYDDVPISAYMTPPMTTIRQAKHDIGSHSASQLVGIMERSNDFPMLQHTILKPMLVARKTT